MADDHTIFLKPGREGEPIPKADLPAGEEIYPGHLIALTSSFTVIKNNKSSQGVFRGFAIEDSLQGKGIDDPYSAGDIVTTYVGSPGDEFLAWLAIGQTCVFGDFLRSNGDGTLKVGTGTFGCLALALETLTTDTEAQRIRIIIL